LPQLSRVTSTELKASLVTEATPVIQTQIRAVQTRLIRGPNTIRFRAGAASPVTTPTTAEPARSTTAASRVIHNRSSSSAARGLASMTGSTTATGRRTFPVTNSQTQRIIRINFRSRNNSNKTKWNIYNIFRMASIDIPQSCFSNVFENT